MGTWVVFRRIDADSKKLIKSARFLVEMAGLEPATPYMRSKRRSKRTVRTKRKK